MFVLWARPLSSHWPGPRVEVDNGQRGAASLDETRAMVNVDFDTHCTIIWDNKRLHLGHSCDSNIKTNLFGLIDT